MITHISSSSAVDASPPLISVERAVYEGMYVGKASVYLHNVLVGRPTSCCLSNIYYDTI